MFAYYACWIKNTAYRNEMFPLTNKVVSVFKTLYNKLCSACLHCINDEELFTVKCNASDLSIGAIINQSGHQVVFMSHTLAKTE